MRVGDCCNALGVTGIKPDEGAGGQPPRRQEDTKKITVFFLLFLFLAFLASWQFNFPMGFAVDSAHLALAEQFVE